MSWEIDSVKRDLERLKWDLYRKVEEENHRRNINDLEHLVSSKFSYLENQISDLSNQLQKFMENYENDKMEIFSTLQQTSK